MQIIYRAFDGKEFDNEADCAYHEAESDIEMYDITGKRTFLADETIVVRIRNKSDAVRFIEKSQAEETIFTGIDEDSRGWFYWDDDESYHYIHRDILRIFRSLEID